MGRRVSQRVMFKPWAAARMVEAQLPRQVRETCMVSCFVPPYGSGCVWVRIYTNEQRTQFMDVRIAQDQGPYWNLTLPDDIIALLCVSV